MIKSIDTKNVGRLGDLHIDCGQIILARGPNASGKTTLINTLTSVFENAHDASLITSGKDKAEITLLLDDGTKITRTITQKGTYGKIETVDGRTIKKEETYLKSLASGFAFEPMRLVNASNKELLEYVFKLFPMRFAPEEIKLASGTLPPADYSLRDLDALIDGREEKRKDAKKKVAAQEATLATLTKTLSADPDKDWRAELRSLSGDLENRRADLSAALSDLDKEQADAVAAKLAEKHTQIADIRARMQREIDDAETAFAIASQQLVSDCQFAKDARRAELQPEIERLAGEVKAAQVEAEAQQRAQGVKDSIDAIRKQIKTDALEAARYHEDIENLRRLRKGKMDSLPIPGVEIRDGDLYVDGFSFSAQLNKAEKFKTALQICARGSGALPILIIDEAEFLDAESMRWVQQGARQAGFQVLITQVADQPELTVEAA